MKHIFTRRSAAWLLTLLLCFSFAITLTSPAHAAMKITQSVDLIRPKKNMSGSGYYWDNIHQILTLNGLYIDTSDEFGLRIPEGATVVLEGKNQIKAAKIALSCPGSVTFQGDGSLALTAEEAGISLYSTNESSTARFLSGTFDITSGGDGIRSSCTSLSVTGGKITISAPAADSFAITGRSVKLYGGNILADNAIHASLSLEIRALHLEVSAEKPALSCDKKLVMHEVSVTAGADDNSMSRTDEYNGENCVVLKSTANLFGESALFGQSVPKFVDYLVVLFLLLLVIAGITAPIVRSRQKAKKALAAAQEAEKAANAAQQEKKKHRT